MHRDQRAHSPHHLAWPCFVPAAGRKLLILIFSSAMDTNTCGLSIR